jgi:hypothetical protein
VERKIPTIKELKEQAQQEPDPCPLCARPNFSPSDHHLIPRTRGGKVTETVCQDCHSAIHATFSNKELERDFNSVDSLMNHAGFMKLINYISKQDGKVKTRLHSSQRNRGRNG